MTMDKQPTGISQRSRAEKDAWAMTNEDMEAIAEQRREEGWDVVAMPAVHTSPVSKDASEDDRFGLVHIIPDNHADDFRRAYEQGEFPEYLVYRREVSQSSFLVTEFIDPESETIILVAARFDLRHGEGLGRNVLEEDELYSYAKTVDGTELGSFYHEEWEPFLPTPEEGVDELREALAAEDEPDASGTENEVDDA